MNLIPASIIVEAVEKGWKNKMFGFDCEIESDDHTVLDPLFWQALGRARQWDTEDPEIAGPIPKWRLNAHKLLDLLLSSPAQEQVDQFWKELP